MGLVVLGVVFGAGGVGGCCFMLHENCVRGQSGTKRVLCLVVSVLITSVRVRVLRESACDG